MRNHFNSFFLSTLATGALASSLALAQGAAPKPDALLAVELNRAAVVQKIALAWAHELPGAQLQSFTGQLGGLRADALLSASLSGSFEGVLEVVHAARAPGEGLNPALGSAHTFYASQSALKNSPVPAAQNGGFLSEVSEKSKTLGDAGADLVYTPITPCRLFDTRAGLASAMGTVGGTFSNQQRKTITPAGACGIPTTGVASLFLSFHAYNNNPAALGVIGFMKPAAAFSAMAATWTGGAWATGTFISQTNPNGSFDAFVGNGQAMTADMIVDVMGYFRAPEAGSNASLLIAGGHGLRIQSASTLEGVFPNVINGNSGNVVEKACPSGTTCAPTTSQITGATIAGGVNNAVTGRGGSVGGGLFNQAGSNNYSVIDSQYATVGGGYLNKATGEFSTIPGGANNVASGDHSFAAGRLASADKNNCAVFGL